MKYALFEFPLDESCEIGQTIWITREDPSEFSDDLWDKEKEVMVKWPCDYSRLSKKIVKASIDPLSVVQRPVLPK